MATLYPPYIEAKQKAFVNTEKGKIYFNTSILNTIQEVGFIQVAINRIDNNQNALESILTGSGSSYQKKYPTGYLFIPSKLDETIFYDDTLDLYYFYLPENLLPAHTLYKIQVRLGQQQITERPDGFWQTADGQIINNGWLSTVKNVQSMSEWSTVGLFKVLSTIDTSIQGMETGLNILDISVYTFVGFIDLKENSNNESVKSTQFNLYENNKLIETSGTIVQPANQKEYNYYTFKKVFSNDTIYKVEFVVNTSSNYTTSVSYDFKAVYSILPTTYGIEEFFDTEGVPGPQLELYKTGARLLVTDRSYKGLTEAQQRLRPNSYIIRKTSEKSNYQDWEEIAIVRAAPDLAELRQVIFDPYIESGVNYQYTVQPVLLNTGRGAVSKPVTINKDYDHSWLVGQDNLYLQIDYNLNVTGYKKVIKETMIETLDSRYPFFVRNGVVNYRTFMMSGVITSEMDVESNLTEYSGYVKEREFRNAFESILMDGQPKVFKTSTEELALVYISNVSLTPNTVLGRRIYDFSCTVTEVGEMNVDNLKKYNLLTSSPIGIGKDLRVPAIVGYVSESSNIVPNKAITGVY